MESILKKFSDENKEVYICGDFNIDLLKLEKVNNYQSYYNMLCSYGYLPLIVQPTRVVENQTPSLIVNIFCNNLSNDIISGNIYLTLSEHFCQFASIKSQKLDIKKITIYARDYSKFSSKDFIDDVAIQNWNYEEEEPSNLFDDFLWKLDGCVERHAPIKKIKTKRDKVKSETMDKCQFISHKDEKQIV